MWNEETDVQKQACHHSHHIILHNSTHSELPQPTDSKPLLNCYPNFADALPYLFKIIPVKLYGPSGKMETFAMFNDGSVVTLLKGLIRRLITKRVLRCLKELDLK